MSILVRNTKERECSVCHKDISPGDLYIPQCQSRSNRGVHCTTCALIELKNAHIQIDYVCSCYDCRHCGTVEGRRSRVWVYDGDMKRIGEQWWLEHESS